MKMTKDTYEYTSITTVNVPEEFYADKSENIDKSYQNLANVLGMGNIEFFTMTVLIGKFIVGQKKETGTTLPFIRYADNLHKDEMTMLYAFAVNEVDSVYILKDKVAMREMWQEYSCAGFEEIYEWYIDKNKDFEVRLSEELNNRFNINKSFYENE